MEYDAWFCAFPGLEDDHVEESSGVGCSHNLFRARVHEWVRLVFLVVLPEVWHDENGQVKVPQRAVSFLCGDELLDVRVIAVEYSHVGAASYSTLLNDLRHCVEESHETYRTRGNP